MLHIRPQMPLLTALATASALLLSACERAGEPEIGEPAALSRAGTQADPQANRQTAQAGAQDLERQTAQAAAKAAQAAQDAAITAGIQAELAKDPRLGALGIRVQTREGLVELQGKAPDAALRDRATRTAATVKGVLSVDNHMSLPG